MNEINDSKSKNNLLFVLLGILCVAVFAGLIYWQSQKSDRKSDASTSSQSNQATDNQPEEASTQSPTESISNADNLYLQGAAEFQQKDYTSAIQYFDQAIAADAYVPQYYSDKSEAQFNMGDKQAAIDTLKQGSSLNPDSDLLKSKLDVLTKDQFNNSSIDATRE